MHSVSNLSDAIITADLKRLAAHERANLARFLEYLAEVDVRRLYAPAGYSSLFYFCMSELKLSESEACTRIRACRLLRIHPNLKSYLVSGQINLATIRTIAPHVTESNARSLFAQVAGLTAREVEKFIAGLAPKADVPDQIRKVPTKTLSAAEQTPASEVPYPRRPSL
jgi:hypothetical protein